MERRPNSIGSQRTLEPLDWSVQTILWGRQQMEESGEGRVDTFLSILITPDFPQQWRP